MTDTDSLIIENTKLPEHVAIIMDGNRRWADHRQIPRIKGHEAGLENMRTIVTQLNKYNVKNATVYAFSTENWSRPKDEVQGLLDLLETRIEKVSDDFHRHNIKLRHLGGLEGLKPNLQKTIKTAIELTENNTGMVLSFAFNYGGRSEIIHAVRRLLREGVPAEEVDEERFRHYLYTDGLPDVDLLIRTGGELRISNFLIWQSAYSEYYFSSVLWPDFSLAELKEAILAYSHRQRRFGRG
jgi:undecaprenyl diphosphate synthase